MSFSNRNFFDSIMRFIFSPNKQRLREVQAEFPSGVWGWGKMCLNLKTAQRQPPANVIAQNSHQSSVVWLSCQWESLKSQLNFLSQPPAAQTKLCLRNNNSENWFFDRSATVCASQGSHVVSIILGIMSLPINWTTMFSSRTSFLCAFCNIISLKIHLMMFSVNISTTFLYNEFNLFIRHF